MRFCHLLKLRRRGSISETKEGIPPSGKTDRFCGMKAAAGGKKKKNTKKSLAKDYDAFDDVGLSTQGGGDHVGFDDGDFM